MLLPDAREAIVTTCQELSRAGLVVGTAGNVSVREGDLVAVTPSGVRYAELTPELVGVHQLDGTAAEAPLAPTSELPLHLAVYTARPGVAAVVHTHSPAATALSALVDEVPAVHYYLAMFGGPVLVAPYAAYGSQELARAAVGALRGRTACLLGNHGAVTVGPDLVTAHEKSVYLEWLCDVYLRASAAGTPRLLPPAEITAVAAKLAGYGQRRSLTPAPAERRRGQWPYGRNQNPFCAVVRGVRARLRVTGGGLEREVAGRQVPGRAERPQRRLDLGAQVLGERAAGPEPAA
jgi:L-fuculose-phosphate aldolase